MKKILLVFILSLMTLSGLKSQVPVFDWALKMGGTAFDRGLGIATDKAGNVYYTGYFSGTADFDPGSEVLNLVSAGNADVFITKFNSAGSFEWAKRVGGTLEDNAVGITVDASGNIYVTGYFRGTVDFDPGPGTYELVSAGSDDIFILKLGSSGNFRWAVRMGGSSIDYSWSTAADEHGYIYNTGYFQGTADFDPGAGTFNMTSAGIYDGYMAKLDSAGKFKWAKRIGGSSHDVSAMISYDKDLNIYITGHYMGTADFDPGPSTVNITSAGQYDAYIGRYDTSGNMQWIKNFGGTGNDYGLSDIVGRQGDIISTGSFQGTVDFDNGYTLTSSGSSDGYILKTDALGITTWAVKIGGAGYDEAFTSAIDSLGNIYCLGYFQGTCDFDPGSGTYNLTSSGNYDVFILKLDADGKFIWAKKTGGSGNDYGSFIALDKLLNIYVSGYFEGTVDFNPETPVYNLTSAGSSDAFLQRFRNCKPTFSDITVESCFNYVAPDGTVYTSSGIKTAVIPNRLGCDSTITINLTIKDVDVSVTRDGNTLTANAASAAYQWWDCNSNNEINGETGRSFTPPANGSYAVRVTQNGCANTSVCYIITTVGLPDGKSEGSFIAYPNPSTGLLFIDLGEVLSEVTIVLSDISGNVIRRLESRNNQLVELRIDEPAGLYVVTVISGSKRSSLRVIKK